MPTQNVSEQNQKHFCVLDTKFVPATNVARAGKQGNICVGNNVSPFAGALRFKFKGSVNRVNHPYINYFTYSVPKILHIPLGFPVVPIR